MQVPASINHINDAIVSGQLVAHSQISLHSESTTWVSRPSCCKAAIKTGCVRTRVSRTLR